MNNCMNQKITSIVLLFLCLLTACTDHWEGVESQGTDSGNLRVVLRSAEMPVIQTRSNETSAYDQIESVNLFVFQQNERTVHKKVFQYFDQGTSEVSMFLTNGTYKLVAVCNWHDPEALYNQVQTLDQLQQVELVLQNPDDAFMGKYVMYASREVTLPLANNANVEMQVKRLASRHEFTISFTPENGDDQFQLTEAWIHNIPKGSWLVPRSDSEPADYVPTVTDDWVYQLQDDNMRNSFFSEARLSLEEGKVESGDETNTKWKVLSSYSLLENRRGGLPVMKAATGYEYNDHYWEESQVLAEAGESALSQLNALRQYYKRYHALNEPEAKDSPRKKFEFATYLTIKGFYKSSLGTSDVTYYVYLGEDGYKDFNVRRNHLYKTHITVRSMNTIDTRVEATSMEEVTMSAPDEILDAHCNVVKAVLFSPDPWEVWVEDPDKTPWLELSGSDVYRQVQMGQTQVNQETHPTFRMKGDGGVLRNIYIHVDEFIPDLKDPMQNSRLRVRTGRIAFRKQGSNDVKHITVKQYPAQLAVLHIKYDIHTMKEVRDTFYIERKLEKKYMPWGLETYWSFITDDLIASGLWDGLSNTRKLYQVALFGDKWGVDPGYPKEKYPNGIPLDCALGYIVNKNRDRDGNEKIDYDEIMWYFPARKEMQYLYSAVQQGLVNFDGSNAVFHSSTPSSADPGGITMGFSYYVKMSNGKYGIGQRSRKYNVLALRRKHNEWSGPAADAGNFTVTVETGWTDEEVIMPK